MLEDAAAVVTGGGERLDAALDLALELVNARLSFTPEGLMTTVDIRRK